MTEKNTFAYKLFLSSIISDCNLFFLGENCNPPPPPPPLPEKSCLLFPSNSLLKVEACQASLFENLVGGSTQTLPPSPAETGRVHTMKWYHRDLFQYQSFSTFILTIYFIFCVLTYVIHWWYRALYICQEFILCS